jgi:hypothetical protein
MEDVVQVYVEVVDMPLFSFWNLARLLGALLHDFGVPAIFRIGI